MQFEIEKFLTLQGLELGEYVDEVEAIGCDLIDDDLIARMLNENNVDFEKKIYLVRWGACKNIPGIIEHAIELLTALHDEPGSQLSVLKSLKQLESIDLFALGRLRNVENKLPMGLWEVEVDGMKSEK